MKTFKEITKAISFILLEGFGLKNLAEPHG